ncbi:MAG: radical SAM protein [Verrucomicrobia bacterium]|nr:radical SAM protein [Verrucomicrobiota bacterium]
MIQYHQRPFRLREFKIEVTHRCELNCVHCSSDARPSNTLEMQREDCLRILAQAVQMGAKEVAFSGGEPLLWTHLAESVEVASKGGLKVTVYTAGVVDDFKAKARTLFKRGAERFIFSIFGGNATSHERITRVFSSFERTCDAVKAAKQVGAATELHFVPLSTNYRELRDVAELGKQLDADQVSVLRLVPQGRATLIQGRALTRVQNLEMRRQIVELRKAGFKIRTGSPYNFLMLNESPACCAGIDRLILGPDLRVYPCDAFKQVRAEQVVGTLNFSCLRNTSLQECWEKSPFLEAIRTYLTTPFPDGCDDCQNLEKCLSGCLAQKVIASGNLNKRSDPECLKARKN